MTKIATENVEKVKHENIYAALSAFQGENVEIKKTKRFGKITDAMTFMYAELGDMIHVVAPFTSKHGLSFTWESAGEGKIQCVLYHETSEHKEIAQRVVEKEESTVLGPVKTRTEEPVMELSNVLRSAPITVARSGKMQSIGSDSTYARKYTLCEVLGIVSDEDTDVPIEEESAKNAVKTVFVSTKDKISKGERPYIEDILVIINKEIDLIEAKKAPKLGMTLDQYNQLGQLAEARLQALGIKEDAEHEEPSVKVG